MKGSRFKEEQIIAILREQERVRRRMYAASTASAESRWTTHSP
jgi:hypothetical protein